MKVWVERKKLLIKALQCKLILHLEKIEIVVSKIEKALESCLNIYLPNNFTEKFTLDDSFGYQIFIGISVSLRHSQIHSKWEF